MAPESFVGVIFSGGTLSATFFIYRLELYLLVLEQLGREQQHKASGDCVGAHIFALFFDLFHSL